MKTLITENLDVWSSAIKAKSTTGRGSGKKQVLYGVKKLRELILELAVRGLLVRQDPSDEPASELVTAVRSSLPDKKPANPFLKEIQDLILDESKYELPMGWKWLPLGHIGIWATGCGFPKKYQGEKGQEFLFCKVSDMNLPGNEVDIHSTVNSIGPGVLAKIRGRVNPAGTVIFPKIGGAIATHKRRLVVKPTIIDNNCSGIQPIGITANDWLMVLMHSLDMTKYQSGTSVPAVSQSSLDPIRIGLPPLAEQHRIVAKVDELMALCDQIEQQQEDSLRTHDTLVATLLAALTAARERGQFAQAWQRIEANFDTLFTTQSSIEQLKQTILQLAVMGKLVEQDPEDEPAGELLKKIAAEKTCLIEAGDIRAQKPRTPITEDEEPYSLPSSWQWCHLGQTGIGATGKTPKTSNASSFGGKVQFIGPGQITPTGKLLESDKTLTEEGANESTEALPGDILMVCIGGSIGKSVVANQRAAFNQQINAIRPIHISSQFLNMAVSTDRFYRSILEKATGSATPIINRSKWEGLVVPVPPLAEQQRIIAKVDELMTLCDRLKENFKTAQTTQLNLADSLAEQAIG